MVKVDPKMVLLLKDRELRLYQQALNNSDIREISHWEKVARSRDKSNNRNDMKRLG